MGAVRSPRPAVRLSRDRALRAHHQQPAPPRIDHQGRLDPRPAAVDRGVLPLPPPSRGQGACSSAASATSRQRSSTSPGKRNDACTPAGASSKTRARSPTASSRSRSPASSPDSAGRSRPGQRPSEPCSAGVHAGGRHPHADTLHPTEAGVACHSLNQASRIHSPVAADEAARTFRHSRTTSPRHPQEHPASQPAALDFRQRTCDETRSWGSSGFAFLRGLSASPVGWLLG